MPHGMPWGACRQGARGKLGLLPRLSLGSAEGLLGALCPNEVFIVRSSFSILNGKQTVKTTSTYAQMMTFKNHLLIPFRVDWADITQPHLLQLTLNGQLRRKQEDPGSGEDRVWAQKRVFCPHPIPVTSVAVYCPSCLWLEQPGSLSTNTSVCRNPNGQVYSPEQIENDSRRHQILLQTISGSQSFQRQLNCTIGYRENFIIARR